MAGFLKSLLEVLEDLMDPDKAGDGDGVRRLRKAKGSFPDSFVKIKPLDPVNPIHFLYGHLGSLGGFLQSWNWCQGARTTLFLGSKTPLNYLLDPKVVISSS